MDQTQLLNHPKKIICFVTTLSQGGTERNLVQYCKAMNRSRFTPEVWYLHETESPLKTVLQEAGVPTRCLNAPKQFQPLYKAYSNLFVRENIQKQCLKR